MAVAFVIPLPFMDTRSTAIDAGTNPRAILRGHETGPNGGNGEELQARYDNLERERNHLFRQLAAVPKVSRDLAERLVEMEQATLSIRQARDLLLTRNHELIAELARADDKIAELGFDNDEAVTARDAALKERDSRIAECEGMCRAVLDLNRQLSVLTAAEAKYVSEAAVARQTNGELTEELTAARTHVAEPGPDAAGPAQKREVAILAGQFAAAQQARAVALQALEKSKAEMNHLVAEREALRAEVATLRATHEQQISALREQLASSNTRPSADASPAQAKADQAPKTPRVATSADPSVTEPLSRAEAAPAIETMFETLDLLSTHPDNLNLVEALDNHLRTFSERAHAAGLAAVHRYSLGCREVTRWLRKAPAKVSSTLHTLTEAVSLLDTMTSLANPATIPDPAGALVYSVDDDADNCECIAAALDKLTLFTKYASKPEVALAELTAIPCDLIILDVNMPGMDGFEICSRVRQMEHHMKTPILFVSGLSSAKEQVKSNKSENVEFIAKPYNLTELGLKALGMVLRGQLAAA